MKRLAMIGIRKNGVWETRFGDNVTIRGNNNLGGNDGFKIIFRDDKSRKSK